MNSHFYTTIMKKYIFIYYEKSLNCPFSCKMLANTLLKFEIIDVSLRFSKPKYFGLRFTKMIKQKPVSETTGLDTFYLKTLKQKPEFLFINKNIT